ncbi:polysaccharide pyruvyl transferase family protein [Sedimentibacter sp.]|uniref:polysaccharide pyruvyl transferase family protein n=1 Tax=Sedimentibacter sp. TaxID=1960295 RepID=UPI0028A1DA48|nr:polysaccharide pyruvyl transferase family protein [Sedimentibacter sp.]
MKYANYKFYAKGVNNIGDNMQLIVIDSIYEQMGVSNEDIIYIDKNELSTYTGEYVILPVTMPLVDYTEGGICGRFSDHIIPVFIGLTLIKDTLLPQEVEYYHQYEPIGCRDERTMNILRKYGIIAYLHGCITATLPKRDIDGKTFDKIFIVDVDSEMISYIPKEILNKAEFLTHSHEDLNDPKDTMKEYYNRYKNEAKLVITKLLHCSVPCIAAGIPVIIMREQISFRFGWLEKLIPVYERSDFSHIDWNPEPIEYEEHKARVLQITMNRLRDTYNKYNSFYNLSWFYEQRDKKNYINDAFIKIKNFIDCYFVDSNYGYEYSIWGLTQTSILTVNYISENFPNAKLMHVYDAYRTIVFEGLYSQLPDEICKYPEEIVFVTTNGARRMALSLFNKIGRDEESYVIC